MNEEEYRPITIGTYVEGYTVEHNSFERGYLIGYALLDHTDLNNIVAVIAKDHSHEVLIKKESMKIVSMQLTQLPIKKCKCIHSGQYHAYGDSERVYEVYTEDNQDIPEEDLLPYLFHLCGRKTIQSQEHWREDYFNADSYFSGYYTLTRCKDYYLFKFVQPYTD